MDRCSDGPFDGRSNHPSDAASSGSTEKPRLFVLSDVRLYREGIFSILARCISFEIIGEAELSAAAIERIVDLRPDVIILDIGSIESLDLAKSLRIRLPMIKVIAIAISEINEIVLACAKLGMAGYVPPYGSTEDLVAAVEHALRGELYCSPRIAALLFRHFTSLSPDPMRPAAQARLTRREQQVLQLVGKGMSNKEIGRALQIGHSTVKNHVHNILDKMQVSRRGAAIARLHAMQHEPTAATAGARRLQTRDDGRHRLDH